MRKHTVGGTRKGSTAPILRQPMHAPPSHHVYQSYNAEEPQKTNIISAYTLRKASMAMQHDPHHKKMPFKNYMQYEKELPKQEALFNHYKDRNCEILGSQLIVERYWIPFWWSYREFDLGEIRAVWYENMNEFTGSSWGLGMNCTHWNLKCCRECNASQSKYNVVFEYDDEKLLKGFSVDDIDTFLLVVSQNLLPSVPIMRGTPDEFSRETILEDKCRIAERNYKR